MSDQVVEAPIHYNPNQLITYKEISDGVVTYPTSKVVDIEWALEQARSKDRQLAAERLDRYWLQDQIVEWYNPNYTKEEVLEELIKHFGFSPTKEIDVSGTVSFSGTISVPLAEFNSGEFDLSNVTVDVELSSYDYEADLNVDDVSLEENY